MTRRLIVIGSPRTGKTTYCNRFPQHIVRHTDDTMHMKWSDASAEVASWFDAPGPWVIEGVSTARALRKWLAAHPDGKPCDEIILMRTRYSATKPGHESMSKGVWTVFDDLEQELANRGVAIKEHCPS